MDACYCDWGEHGGDWCLCTTFFQGNMECCEPCCGQPCNTDDGIYCCLSWFPGCFCSVPLFYAHSQGQPCAWLNHFAPFITLIIPIVGTIVMLAINTAIRFNLRKKYGIGESTCHPCDCLAALLPCMWCQEVRGSPKESWDWYQGMQDKTFPGVGQVDPCYMFCVPAN